MSRLSKPAWMLLIIGFWISTALNVQAASSSGTTPEKNVIEKTTVTPSAKKIPCLDCHEDPTILSILKTKHAVMADKRTPYAQEACQTCHGESAEHMNSSGEESPSVKFGPKSKVPVAEQNQVCLKCHESGARMEWKGSQHEMGGLACSTCHTIHADKDKTLNRRTQPEVCFNCHKGERAQIHRFSSHPIKEGKMSCGGCHNPHGAPGPKLLREPTLNETCYLCHAEKRGPFLWEHQPVREDCSICHTPHGSSHKPLLNTRGPWLCQQCHQEEFHPSIPYSGLGLPSNQTEDCLICHAGQVRTGAFNHDPDPISVTDLPCNDCHTKGGSGPLPSHGGRFVPNLLGKNCFNCHSQIHGSNHPSGARKTR